MNEIDERIILETEILRKRDFGRYVTPRSVLNVVTTRLSRTQLSLIEFLINGNDLSKWNYPVNFDIMEPKVDFTILRAGYGSTRDPRFTEYRTNCVKKNLKWGLYWFVYVGYNMDSQLNAAISVINEGGWNLPPVMDFEYTILSKSSTTAWIKEFMERLQAKVGVRLGIYTSPGWWNYNVYNNSWAVKYFLWVAHWTSASSPILPYDWRNVGATLWQWTADNNGKGAEYGSSGDPDMDLDRYVLSIAEWAKFSGNGNGVPAPNKYVRITASPCLRMRSKPEVSAYAVILDCIPYNTTVEYTEVVKLVQSGYTNTWIQVSYNGKIGWCAAYYQGHVYAVYI